MEQDNLDSISHSREFRLSSSNLLSHRFFRSAVMSHSRVIILCFIHPCFSSTALSLRLLCVCSEKSPSTRVHQARARGRSSPHGFTLEAADLHPLLVVGILFVPRVHEQLCSWVYENACPSYQKSAVHHNSGKVSFCQVSST